MSVLGIVGWIFFSASAVAEEFTFTLPVDSYTSAGVCNSKDELIRTLWSRVRYVAGKHSGSWDGKDDNGKLTPPGDHHFELIRHNVTYVWDGVVGNTSSSFTGNIHTSGTADNIQDLAYDGGNYIYEALGYNEGAYDVRRFPAADPQRPEDVLPFTTFTNFALVAADGERIYCASVGGVAGVPASANPANYSTFILAREAQSGFPPYTFIDSSSSQSVGLDWQPDGRAKLIYPSCIDVHRGKAWDAITGLAVQRNGNLLAASHGGDNKVLLFDKRAGIRLNSIDIPNPRRLAFASNGDLWILGGAPEPALWKLSARESKAQLVTRDLIDPLAISTGAGVVLVADGKVRMFDGSTGKAIGSYGQPQANDSQVTYDKFRFGNAVGLTALDDGSFWIGDGGCAHGGTNRTLHISAQHSCDGEIAWLGGNYTTAVDPSDPARVFWDFLEYRVDYSKPLAPANGSWKLVRNWLAGQDPASFQGGPHTVVTLANGKTYCLIRMNEKAGRNGLFELTQAGSLRDTGQRFLSNYSNHEPASEALAYSLFPAQLRHSDAKQVLYGQDLEGFDEADNPVWGPSKILAAPKPAEGNPLTGRGNPYVSGWQLPETSSGDLIVFDQSENSGWHLGAIAPGSDHFRWRASHSTLHDVPMDGLGSFDIGDGTEYKGNKVVTSGRNVIYGYNGEMWNQAEAGQHMHYFDNGLFIGQFGTTGSIVSPLGPAVPGFAGNDFCPSIARVGADTYLYVNDESAHGGIHRCGIL